MDTESGSTPSGGDASPRPSEDLENSSPITPASFTHNHVVADCHLKNFNQVIDALKSAADRVSTSHHSGHKYASMHALLLSWEGDDLGVGTEVANLGDVLSNQYAFDVRQWEIPMKKSTIKLTKLIVDWTEEYEREDNLLLVYYGGHGRMDSSRQAIWSNRRNRDELYAEVKWSGCEEVLHESISDTLFLLDCCHAGSSISQALKGFSETIAASGFEYIAPPPGPHSFTNALTRILFDWSRSPHSFTIAALHAEILTYLKIIPPDQLTRDGLRLATASSSMEMEKFEWRRTPVHYIRSTYKYISSIILAPKARETTPFIDLRNLHLPKPTNSPRVVLSISLTEDIRADDAESCRRWLTDFPLPTEDITVEAVFKSFSTVVLISVALEIWDVLPEIPGCNFVCYSQSKNLLGHPLTPHSTQKHSVTFTQPDSWWPPTENNQRHGIAHQPDNSFERKPMSVPAESIFLGKSVTKSSRPNLKIGVPGHSRYSGPLSEAGSVEEASPEGMAASGPGQRDDSLGLGIVLPPASPSPKAMPSLGAKGPPNPFARPFMEGSFKKDDMEIDTPVSASSSRFSNDLGVSPTAMYGRDEADSPLDLTAFDLLVQESGLPPHQDEYSDHCESSTTSTLWQGSKDKNDG
ncbi:hypothetical protein PFICI_07858 [Pestalotiopsis fici W106-1]|uniref:Peptidase C14 caspase domain-containing protein n=1 Tax=Pestalotiopsis fici (strain W106-1 / CGMCC3.15140) TaxID=1229662 RepID=W3X2U9_PESFW|nr:uncharacterized protein PFICI_07858 [Pestalotiopsis fici W106-1]ETS80329.1 hypothetical protein PFICI_07858 [Pestalotiopsis fici W106-1]